MCTHCHRKFFEDDLIEFEDKLFCESCLGDVGLAYCSVCNKYYQIIDDDYDQKMCYECRKDLEHLKWVNNKHLNLKMLRLELSKELCLD